MTGINVLGDLGPIGLWTDATDQSTPGDARELAQRVEDAGYGCLWLPEGMGHEVLTHASMLLHATTRLPVASGIASIWARDPLATHAGTRLLREAHGGRFLLGLGVSHRLVVDSLRGHTYGRPVTAMGDYLMQLESLDQSFGDSGPRIIAALGPRMIDLAAEHGAGILTYLTTAEHTAATRHRYPSGHLSVEIPIVIGAQAPNRARARNHLATYLALENYRASFLRQGFKEADLEDQGSDRLIDTLVIHGDLADVHREILRRRSAGADHVALHPLDEASLSLLLSGTADQLA
jgi:probable F420-dependent oxidoreductase